MYFENYDGRSRISTSFNLLKFHFSDVNRMIDTHDRLSYET